MPVKPDIDQFKSEIASRKIEHLIHFTPTINLLSILEQGKIYSRKILEDLNIEETDILDYAEFTDLVRYDDKSYINLSISFPNSFLLSRFVQKTALKLHVVWCVLKIDPKYIYQQDTLFSITNAANSHNKRIHKITGDFEKFKMMFSNSINVVSSTNTRVATRNNLDPKYPTDVQAEVLVRDEIPVSDILQICFRNQYDLASTKAALSNFDTSKFCVDELIFSNSRI